MASVESTERRASRYRTLDWIRVRREEFGLLFYDTRSTQLTFVRSGDLLTSRRCTLQGRPVTLVEAVTPGDPRLERVLGKLADKGLLAQLSPASGGGVGA